MIKLIVEIGRTIKTVAWDDPKQGKWIVKATLQAARDFFSPEPLSEPLAGHTGMVRWHNGNLEYHIRRPATAPDGNGTWEYVWVPESQKETAAAPREKDGG